VKGDVAIIAGRAIAAAVVPKRRKLEDRIEQYGFNQTMEMLAYTWFNRFIAIRFMELHGYLEHGYRVLSHPDPTKTVPEILELAEHIDLPGLSREKIIDLKLEGNKESELYRMLLLAQCHALHSTMPFLFEGIDDETELVLPENLLHSDSIIRKLVAASAPGDWEEVEVLGWLYQYYNSERKDEVMARKSAVPTEDIPAVTQLFTPHWIVRYLVENSLGRLWLLNTPGSKLREHMPYYIEAGAETDFLKIGKPEDIRLLDPACGSGHMLAYAFDLLFLIYTEEGYIPDEIPALILRHNLYGLEICPRASQLANLALVFKAREKSRRFMQPGKLVQPNVLALQNIHFDDSELRDYTAALDLGGLFTEPMIRLLHQFEEATTFGSLIQPCLDEAGIAYARQAIETKDVGGQLFLRKTNTKVLRVLAQAEILCRRYHVVVTNPPYLGRTSMNPEMRVRADELFPRGKADLYAMFIERCRQLSAQHGFFAMVTMHSWMFLISFKALRNSIATEESICSMLHLGPRGFDSISGEVVQTAAFVCQTQTVSKSGAVFFRLVDGQSEAEKVSMLNAALLDKGSRRRFVIEPKRFTELPDGVFGYWLTDQAQKAFSKGKSLDAIAKPRQGLATTNNSLFLRFWHEVALGQLKLDCRSLSECAVSPTKWYPVNKGGTFRRWYGNHDYVVDFAYGGKSICDYIDNTPGVRVKSSGRVINREFYFREGITWSSLGTSFLAMRYSPSGRIFETKGSTCFFESHQLLLEVLGFTNSSLVNLFISILAPTLDFHEGPVGNLPIIVTGDQRVAQNVEWCISLARTDWDNFETSWDFTDQPLLRPGLKGTTVQASWRNWETQCTNAIRRMQELETENNRLFISAYGLDSELQPEVPEEQITLARADARRDMTAFLSYAVGCMMGRYSLDKPGLILADAGDSLTEYVGKVGKPLDGVTFSPSEDGIIPVTEGEWFAEDIVGRTHSFLRTTFGEVTLEANVRFIEESVGKDMRKYFVTEFYKDHLQTYKKRPIYWLFSSGKERAFQALVYLHRYREGTLSRMRTEYVIPLQGRISSRIDQLAGDIQRAASTSHRKKMEKERDVLLRQRAELQAFDDRLRHYSDQRIQLDLDDGVKVNYGKFGDLLAEVKAVTGGSDE
jgi:hypothetical protein